MAALYRAEPEVVDVVTGSRCGRGSGRLAHDRDDLRTALLHLGEEGTVQPGVVVDDLAGRLAADSTVEGVWVLSGRVIAPDVDVIDRLDGGARLVSQLADGSALVKAGQRAEVLLGDGGRIVRADEGIGVSWVADDAHLYRLLGHFVDGGTLRLENLGVCLKQVRAFHAGATWARTDQHTDVGVLEAYHRVSGRDYVLHAGVRAILELHDQALENLLGRRQLNQLHNHLGVGAKHPPLGNEVAKERADLTSCASDCDSDSGLFQIARNSWEVAAERLQSVDEDVVLHFCACFNQDR